MRIAQVSPLAEAVPPRFYGGTERVVATLCDSMVDLGHDVTLFASAESSTKATLIPMRDQALRLDTALWSDVAAHLNMLDEVRARAAQFDIIHFHLDCLQMPMFADIAHKTLTTLHGRLDIKDLDALLMRWRQFPLASISDDQRRPVPAANFVGTVYHGFPKSQFQFNGDPTGYLAFLGRISPEKRPDRAIEIAKRTGIPLRIAAKVDRVDMPYFKDVIEPLLNDPLIEFIGEVDDSQKSEFLGNARALLFPIDWPEPFGLVMIEAMACGTPVIAWPCGAVPEVIDDGVTGLLVRDMDMAVRAALHITALDRRRVRQVFEQRFSAEVMAQGYIDIYRRLIAAPHVAKPARRPANAMTAVWVAPPAAAAIDPYPILPTSSPGA